MYLNSDAISPTVCFEKVVGKFTLLHFCLRLSRFMLIPERGQKRLLEMRSVGEVGLIIVFVCFNICDTQSAFNSYILVRQLLFRIWWHCCMSSKNNSLSPVWREALSFFGIMSAVCSIRRNLPQNTRFHVYKTLNLDSCYPAVPCA